MDEKGQIPQTNSTNPDPQPPQADGDTGAGGTQTEDRREPFMRNLLNGRTHEELIIETHRHLLPKDQPITEQVVLQATINLTSKFLNKKRIKRSKWGKFMKCLDEKNKEARTRRSPRLKEQQGLQFPVPHSELIQRNPLERIWLEFPTPADGWCMIHAIYRSLHIQLRPQVVLEDFNDLIFRLYNYLTANMIIFMERAGYQNRSTYCTHLFRYFTEKDYNLDIVDAIPYALSELLQVNIHIINKGGPVIEINMNEEWQRIYVKKDGDHYVTIGFYDQF